jgi:polysaccharide pyruvyl transferase WcaK-like protein
MHRRTFLQASFLSLISTALPAGQQRAPRILLRSSWQTVNIGDIGHTPGVLRLLEQHLPQAEVTLWPIDAGNGVSEMLRKRFPKVPIVLGGEQLQTAMKQADFLLHGSGPSLVAEKQVRQWHEQTGKPFGVFGITLPTLSDSLRDLLSAAKFVFCRDSVSLQLAKDRGVRRPVLEFGPDGAFAVDLRNDEAAESFLKQHALEPGKFLCCIPRYRFTPFWLIKKNHAFDEQKHQHNEEMKEHDHTPLRAAITAVVQQAGLKVLLCPEDQTQMALGKEMLLDKLPEDVRHHVVWRKDYWLTDEALSTYVRSAGLFGMEMHSPIMCIGNGIPAIVGRFAEQTSKGFMWKDIGLGDWLFDMDNPQQVKNYPAAVLELARNPQESREKAAQARATVQKLQQGMVKTLAEALG